MALKLVKPGTGVFQVRGGDLVAVNAVEWQVWSQGRIYPPAGTYWVERTEGVNLEKRGSETVKITAPALLTFAEGDYLLLQFRQDGQAVRVTPV